jgi:BlaI family transcriptional regulator, penicillinase repressor
MDGCRGGNSLGQIESRMRRRNPTMGGLTAVLFFGRQPRACDACLTNVYKVDGAPFDPVNAPDPSSLSTVPTSLTDLQLAIMRILWDRAEATVLDVQNRLRPERDLAQTTIATLLSRLEKRGVVEHRLDGRQFVYRPLITEQDVRGSMVSELTELLFNGSSAALMSHLLRSRDMNPGDLDRVKRMIAEAENGTRRAASVSREAALNDGDGDAG